MPEFDRILTAYEHRLRQLTDELVADLDPSAEERLHLALVTQLVQSIVRTYDSFQITRPVDLDASTSVMYAAAGQEGRGILNVPLRSLVDSGTLSPAQARYLNGNLGMRRTSFISGGANVGKSTVLNALIGLLPGDMRLAVIRDDMEELPALRGRPVLVQITAQSGTPDREASVPPGRSPETGLGHRRPATAGGGPAAVGSPDPRHRWPGHSPRPGRGDLVDRVAGSEAGDDGTPGRPEPAGHPSGERPNRATAHLAGCRAGAQGSRRAGDSSAALSPTERPGRPGARPRPIRRTLPPHRREPAA